MTRTELAYAEAAAATRPVGLSYAAEKRQRLAALVPHRSVGGDYCTSCGLPEPATIHHWSTR